MTFSRCFVTLSTCAMAVVACGCLTPMAHPVYDVGLKEVQRPASAQQRYGNLTITPVKDSAGRYRFDDALVGVTFFVRPADVLFSLDNKTEFPMQIAWNDAAFVDPAGRSQPVMHIGVKYVDCTSPKAPSVVVGHGHIDDSITPCSAVRMGSYGWVDVPYFPDPEVLPVDMKYMTDSLNRTVVGKSVKVLLPIRIQDVVNDYTFSFEVRGVTVSQPKRP